MMVDGLPGMIGDMGSVLINGVTYDDMVLVCVMFGAGVGVMVVLW